ncbi:MAG: DUF1015 family protein, partial [Thermoplasmata archaeon]
MVVIKPFKGLRPKDNAAAEKIAALPYDVMNREEAKKMADGNPLSFLHVSRAEIDLPDAVDPYNMKVYQKA